MSMPVGVVSVYKRGEDIRLTSSFHLKEFECKCGKCPFTLVSLKHVERLQELRNALGSPVKITSGYRCPEHNKVVGGEDHSYHMLGLATDVAITGYVEWAHIFDGIGTYDTFTHVDSRGDKARWDSRGKK